MSEFRDDLRSVAREISVVSGAALHETTEPIVPRHLSSPSPVARAFRWLKNVTGAENTGPTFAAGSASTPEVHETPQTSIGDKERKSVAILPFKNLSNDPETSFYEFSLADAVITELARVRSLIVRPSSSIVKYQGKQLDPCDAGREMSVDSILTASFLRAGDRLRVTAQLLDVRTEEILWSESIDADASDIIGVQDTMVQRIVEGLRLELSSDEKDELAKGSTSDSAASEEYLRGRNCLGQFIYHTISRGHVDQALIHFQNAVRLDPEFALAYSAMGSCYVNRVLKGIGDLGDHEKAESAFAEALRLDPKLLEARMHMVLIYLHRGEKPRAREEVERLREEYPNDVGVHFVRGILARLDGDYDRALRSFDRMVRLNPAELVVASYNRARIHMYRQEYEEALAELDKGAALEPDHPLISAFRARVLYYRGEVDAAARILQKVLLQHPIDGIRPILAICLSAQGKHTEASEQLTKKVRQVAAADHDISNWLASAYLLQGKQVEALNWLETSIRLGNENVEWFESDPNWADLRDDPRFLKLMESIKQGRQERHQTA